MNRQNNSYIFYGLLALLATFVLGFGVMYFFWIKIGTSNGLPGLFDYKAATYGDSICLPFLIGTMVMFTKKNGLISNFQRKKCFIGGIFFAILGIFIQAEWLINDETKPNWTIPEKNVFNIAGWYHSLFFIVMFFCITYLFLNVRYIVKEKTENYSFSEKMLLILSVASGALYMLCYVSDDYSFLFLHNFAYIAVVILAYILFIILLANKNISRAEIMFIISNGLIIAIGLYNLIVLQNVGNLFTSIAGALCMAVIYEEKSETYEFVALLLFVCLSTVGIFGVFTGSGSLEDKIVMLGVFIFLIITININNGLIRDDSKGLVPIVIAGILLIDSVIGNNGFEKIAPSVFTLLVAFLFKKSITTIFGKVTDAEQQKGKKIISDNEFKRIKTIAYLKIVFIVITLIFLLFTWLYKIAQSNGTEMVIGHFNINFYYLCTICIGISLLFLFGLFAKKIRCFQYLSLIVVAGEYILLFCCCIDMFKGIKDYKLPLPALMILAFAFFANFGGALMMEHGFRMNIAILRGLETSVPVKILSKIIAVGCFFISYSTTILAALHPNVMGGVCSIILLIFAFIIVPFACAFTHKIETESNKIIPNSAMGGVAQDSFMLFLTVLFASYLPNRLCGAMGFSDTDLYAVAANLLCIIGLLICSFSPVIFCLRNNKEHLVRQRIVAGNDENLIKIWETLRKEILIQSYQTCVTTLPYIFVVFLWNEFVRYCDSKIKGGLKEELKAFKNEYIETDNYDIEMAKEKKNE